RGVGHFSRNFCDLCRPAGSGAPWHPACRLWDSGMFRTVVRTLTFRLFLVPLTSACRLATSPLAPSPAGPGDPLVVPEFLAPSVAVIDSDSRPVPILDEAAGPWLRRVIRGVVVDPTL